MLNQVQYHQAFVENRTNEEAGGFQGEFTPCPLFFRPNE